jgi:poly-gamma-glutamate capsule biosynthesis protein CapA/YwtB (metallophosphatase superfamily)
LPAGASDRFVLVAGGDVMPVLATATVIVSRGPDYPFVDLAPLFRRGDAAFANLEAPLTTRGAPTPGKSPEEVEQGQDYVFRGSPRVASALRRAGLTIASTANNHVMDFGSEGLLDTLAHLRAAGVRAVGAGPTLQDARAPRFLEAGGLRLAFLAYSDVLPRASVATARSPGIAPAKGYWTGRAAEEELAADVQAARRRADHVVVSLHWGDEMATMPNCRQVTLARKVLAAGAAVVLGHHPHVLQPVELREGRLVAYSLGNLVASPRSRLAGESALLRIVLGPRGVESWDATPLIVAAGRPRPADDATAAVIARRLTQAVRCRAAIPTR